METISREEFKTKYGEASLNQFNPVEPLRRPVSQNFAIGAMKGVGDTVFETGNLITETGRYGQALLDPKNTISDLREQADAAGNTSPKWAAPFAGANQESIRSSLKAEGGAQLAGKGAAFVAEMFNPVTAGAGLTAKGGRFLNSIRSTMRGSVPDDLVKFDTKKAGQLLSKLRVHLSDIDPKYETVLNQQTSPDKVIRYFDEAEKAAADASYPMPTRLASKRGEEAFNAIEAGKNEAGALKSSLLDAVGDMKLTGNIPGRAIDDVKDVMGSRYGVEINNTGNITQLPGRIEKIDNKSKALLSTYVSKLRELGPSPTSRQLDDFVDWAQGSLYKQSSPNRLDVADKPVIAFLKQQTEAINSQLKHSVDGTLKARGMDANYGELNDTYAHLSKLSDDLSRGLGSDGDKGASLMKSLFSPQTGEKTRRMFQQVKDETGIDLFEEATLAKFAMESVGDPRSKSLLQEIDDLAGDVTKLNLLEPGSWVNFLREKADLDGRELAEAIIKQNQLDASDVSKSTPPEKKGFLGRLLNSSKDEAAGE